MKILLEYCTYRIEIHKIRFAVFQMGQKCVTALVLFFEGLGFLTCFNLRSELRVIEIIDYNLITNSATLTGLLDRLRLIINLLH